MTATPGPSGWAQVHEFAPDDPEKLRLRGRLFAVVATERVEEGIDTIASGRELISRLHEEYFGSLTEKPFDALRNASWKVAAEFRQSWGDVEIAACALVGGVVYSAAFGGSQVIICREGALATILASHSTLRDVSSRPSTVSSDRIGSDSKSSDEVISASGYPKEGDVVLLATKAFFEKVSPGVIKAALTSGSPEGAAETFAPMIHGGVEKGTLGAAIIKFDGRSDFFAVPKPKAPEIQKKTTPLLKQKLADWFSKFSKKIPQKSIYVRSSMGDEVTSQSRKLTLSVGVILLIILIVSIGFGIRQKMVNDLKKKYQGILQEAQSDVDQAIGLASVSPDKSRELFTDSEQKLGEILSLKVNDPKVTDLQKKIDDSRGAILGEYQIEPVLFLDLSLLSSGFNGDVVSSSGGNIFILDKLGKRIVSVVVETKKSKVVAGPTVIDGVDGLASYQDSAFILSSDGIYQLGLGKTKVIDKTWTGDALISAFAGNIYVLDKSGGAIYRYQGQAGNTFGGQQNWLSAGSKVNFSDASAWGMDGAVYVLYPASRILKYSLGSPQNFSISGVIPEIGNVDAIYADPDNQYLYLLDKAGKRVVVVDKKGKYKAQYISDQIAGATGLVVSEAQKEIILLTGDKLLSIEIKHL